jgi:hypothetical protein
MHNLTGHCSIDNQGFCVLWHEAMSGRTGNDIASCVTKLLEEIIKMHPSITTFTLWSDSCIPQNKNCNMSCALVSFLKRHPGVLSVMQKFGEPGHSPVQEIDNLHSPPMAERSNCYFDQILVDCIRRCRSI